MRERVRVVERDRPAEVRLRPVPVPLAAECRQRQLAVGGGERPVERQRPLGRTRGDVEGQHRLDQTVEAEKIVGIRQRHVGNRRNCGILLDRILQVLDRRPPAAGKAAAPMMQPSFQGVNRFRIRLVALHGRATPGAADDRRKLHDDRLADVALRRQRIAPRLVDGHRPDARRPRSRRRPDAPSRGRGCRCAAWPPRAPVVAPSALPTSRTRCPANAAVEVLDATRTVGMRASAAAEIVSPGHRESAGTSASPSPTMTNGSTAIDAHGRIARAGASAGAATGAWRRVPS